MRLLRIEDGEFRLEEYVGRHVPEYAILSHTWGTDHDEITFKDLLQGTTSMKSKPGYMKLCFCRDQAALDGLQYFWVDTCCIDKTSSAELSEAINSMFRWYHKATKCYAYLSDVSAASPHSLQESRWFTRGWTLQELIAPKSVEFFSVEGHRLGDKQSLHQVIHGITGIAIDALHGNRPLSEFTVEEKLSWAKRRDTKREEDAAYSLLGLFDVYMPLLYGEGRERALIRLNKEVQESLWGQVSMLSSTRPETQDTEATMELRSQQAPSNNLGALVQDQQLAYTQQKILDSLRILHTDDRRDQVHDAHNDTFEWIFRLSDSKKSQPWDSLIEWVSSSTDSRRIYWIHGKPGSGKSTMMRFLDQNIVKYHYMLPWASRETVLKAHHFFWSAGKKHQNSIDGLLRALLWQLLDAHPSLIRQVISARKWASAARPGNHPTDWTKEDLQQALHEFIRQVQGSYKVLLLLDGLDEFDGSDDAQEEMINFLINLTALENVKICLSSRPWNIFRDSFGQCPQLRLEDLTHDDISTFVRSQLHGHARFRHMLRYDRHNAEGLIIGVTSKAAGVFLWVRLVVRELLKGLRDGDGIQMLDEKLGTIPSDLNLYFRRLMDSISPHQRQEASKLLQIMLYEERDFATLHSVRVIDLSFVDEACPDFVVAGRLESLGLDFTSREEVDFRLDSTSRRINSRCMGLLEWQHEDDPLFALGKGRLNMYLMSVSFLHRSCRDFLLTPEIQSLLHQYTKGEYDARMYLLNARIAQLMALTKASIGKDNALGLASNIMSTLGLPMYKDTPVCSTLAAIIQPNLERLIQRAKPRESGWYIHAPIAGWRQEQSSFLTLAIDFDLRSYVKARLTADFIRQKRGRPVLDYILRPRFLEMTEWMSIGNARPIAELLRLALDLGASPNEMYGSASVWALFLCLIADGVQLEVKADTAYTEYVDGVPPRVKADVAYTEYVDALEMLIRAGAALVLPRSWLSEATNYEVYSYDLVFDADSGGDGEYRFLKRWPGAKPVGGYGGEEPMYAVRDLLERFRDHVGQDFGRLSGLFEGADVVMV